MPLLLILFLVPLVETWLLIKTGGIIGAVPTIALVIFTAMIGGALVKRQGLATLSKIQQLTAQGQAPAKEMAEGALIVIAGAFLITPGFVTDTFGFLLLWPQFRHQLISYALQRGLIKLQVQAQAQAHTHNQQHQQQNTHPNDPTVIDGEFKRVD